MALTDILEKIQKETELKIAEIENDFNKKMKDIEQDFENKQKSIDKNVYSKIEDGSKKILDKAKNLAKREAKNHLLESKRKIIDECIQEAIEELSNSNDYEKFLVAILKNIDIDDNAEIIPAKGKEDITEKAVKASGKGYKLIEASSKIKNGFIIKTDKVEIDNSFSTIINKQLREDLEIKLNKILFK